MFLWYSLEMIPHLVLGKAPNLFTSLLTFFKIEVNLKSRCIAWSYQLVKSNRIDLVGVQETNKENFHVSFLKNLIGPVVFSWNFLPAIGTAGGILPGTRDDALIVNNFCTHTFSVSCIIHEIHQNFSWKLVVVYGPAYKEKKVNFIDELHSILAGWQGPILVG
jgi:hypothetical protein